MHGARIAPDLVERCVKLAADLRLPFVGIDLKRTPAGEYYRFVVSPCPAFPISRPTPASLSPAPWFSI